ncbi:MAG: SPFH domain-containing protein [Kineosporiaceae bacterium]|nr:SPFH domain-containing protein [Kineosporiaceae bacterium]
MADITRRLGWRHLRGTPTAHVVHLRRGRTVHAGTGQAFWFRSLTASLSEIPVDDRELSTVFHARTADLQDLTVQASVGYRFADPELAATRIDFGIHPDTGLWRATPLDQVALLLTELAQHHGAALMAGQTLGHVLAGGVEGVRTRIEQGLQAEPRLSGIGIEIVGVRVIAVRPEPAMERALQAPAREAAQTESDRATFERRALAVERERAISENELQSRIELARREEQLVAQQGTNARREATEAAAAARIQAEAAAERDRITGQASADRVRLLGEAEADAVRAGLDAHRDVEPRILAALALQQLAGHLPEIGSITLTPDLVSGGLSRLLAGAAVAS